MEKVSTELYSVVLSQSEIIALRQSLDIININGKDAKLIAQLQFKLESVISEIQSIQKTLEQSKLEELSKLSKEIVSQ